MESRRHTVTGILDGTPTDLTMAGGIVASIVASRRTDIQDRLVPGFVDLQVNGAGGIDLADQPEGVWDVARLLPRYGVTSFLPTLVSCATSVVERALAVLAAGPPADWRGARPLGWHLEGPMLNPARAGAHDAASLKAPGDVPIDGWSAEAGVAMVTIAPELRGAFDVIAALTSRGVCVSIGHTEAAPRDVAGAVAAGARGVTHLFNAMAREGPIVDAILTEPRLVAGLIGDGVHMPAGAMSAAWRALGPGRRVLVSDAVAPLGAPAGRYRLGNVDVEFDGDRVTRCDDGRLAGSATPLDVALRRTIAATGCPFDEAIAAVTTAPALLLGRAEVGALSVGARADLAVLRPDLTVAETYVAGVPAFRDRSR